jgi:diguanylate cyclase (GGDEF)-like protein/PAS domain S-box-containing protein
MSEGLTLATPPVVRAGAPGDYDFSFLFKTELAMFSVAGPDGFFREINPAFERLLGRSRTDLLEHSLFEYVFPADIPKTLQGLSEIENGLSEVAFENRWLHADGSILWLAWVAKHEGGSGLWYATARDVTEYRRVQESLQEVQQRLSLALSVAQAGSWDWSVARDRLVLDPGAELLLGLLPNQFQGGTRELMQRVHRGDRRRLLQLLRTVNKSEDSLDTDFRLQDESKGTIYISLRGRVVARNRRGKPERAVGIAFDVTSQKALEEQLLALVMHDPLTGVRNRRSFDQSLRNEWRRCTRMRLPLSVLMIDIDEFKRYNDTYGHQSGDEALCAVARALSKEVNPSADLLARYGGEEFIALLPDTNIDQATGVAARMLESVRALQQPHTASALGFVTISIGVASAAPLLGGRAIDLIGSADQALYRAKRTGRNRLSD